MEKRLSLITLGVSDFHPARSFYGALGWTVDGGADDEADEIAFFQAGGMIVALWDRAKLAKDSGVENSPGWGGVTLAQIVRSPEQVDNVIEEARAAGATIPREPGKTFGAATPASSSILAVTRGKSHTTRAGRSTMTARTTLE